MNQQFWSGQEFTTSTQTAESLLQCAVDRIIELQRQIDAVPAMRVELAKLSAMVVAAQTVEAPK